MTKIHPTAIVDRNAELGEGVDVGPYCVIGGEVRLGDRTQLHAHVHLDGYTQIGADCTVYPFACLGTRTQDLKYAGGRPGMKIGDGTTIREYVTVNAATSDGDWTVVGSRCLLMAYAHVAHDCVVGNRVVMANCVTLAGHIEVEDGAILGGLSAVHQFVRIGTLSIIGGCSKVVQDVPPYMMADGHPLKVRGLNKIGLKRNGVDDETQALLKQAYKILYRKNLTTGDALSAMEQELGDAPEIERLRAFIGSSQRGITK